jgi:hypothetical protein
MDRFSPNAPPYAVAQLAPPSHNGGVNETSVRHSTHVHAMMSQSEPLAIDEWRHQQSDLPSCAEAIRRLIQRGLSAKAPMSTSEGKLSRAELLLTQNPPHGDDRASAVSTEPPRSWAENQAG